MGAHASHRVSRDNGSTTSAAEPPQLFVPRHVDDAGLSVWTFRALAHVSRRAGEGIFFEGGTRAARSCGMSLSRWKQSLQELVGLGVLARVDDGERLEKVPNGGPGRAARYRYLGVTRLSSNRVARKPGRQETTHPVVRNPPTRFSSTHIRKSLEGVPLKEQRPPLPPLDAEGGHAVELRVEEAVAYAKRVGAPAFRDRRRRLRDWARAGLPLAEMMQRIDKGEHVRKARS